MPAYCYARTFHTPTLAIADAMPSQACSNNFKPNFTFQFAIGKFAENISVPLRKFRLKHTSLRNLLTHDLLHSIIDQQHSYSLSSLKT